MFNEAKAKNDKPKYKNDESIDFEDLMTSDDNEPDDRYARNRSDRSIDMSGVGGFVSDAMQYPFDGANALPRVMVAALVSLIPFIGSMVVSGYGVRVIRRTLRGQSELPMWNDFGGDLMRGLTMFFGSLVFGFLMILSMVAVVTIPVVLLLGFPMVAYAACRYAATDDFSSFVDIFGAYRYVIKNFWTSLMVTISAFIIGIVWSILIGLGFVFFVIPGLLLSSASVISFTYLMGAWGRKVGLEA
jgi:hypothetical protein